MEYSWLPDGLLGSTAAAKPRPGTAVMLIGMSHQTASRCPILVEQQLCPPMQWDHCYSLSSRSGKDRGRNGFCCNSGDNWCQGGRGDELSTCCCPNHQGSSGFPHHLFREAAGYLSVQCLPVWRKHSLWWLTVLCQSLTACPVVPLSQKNRKQPASDWTHWLVHLAVGGGSGGWSGGAPLLLPAWRACLSSDSSPPARSLWTYNALFL